MINARHGEKEHHRKTIDKRRNDTVRISSDKRENDTQGKNRNSYRSADNVRDHVEYLLAAGVARKNSVGKLCAFKKHLSKLLSRKSFVTLILSHFAPIVNCLACEYYLSKRKTRYAEDFCFRTGPSGLQKC